MQILSYNMILIECMLSNKVQADKLNHEQIFNLKVDT